MKRRDVEIIQRDGRFLVLMAREPLPLSLTKMARDGEYKMASLSDRIGVSERHLRRVFEEGIGISPKDWLRQERMVAARALLREGSPIKEVAIDLGFTTAKMFSRDFQLFHGVKPTDFQRKEFGYSLNASS
ncbi:MAG: helix-turn-helix domain-containing protein [Luteolibacter sp.]|uniref:helix-turn-helix domain-containing protein n=1 Tax=Luteolibacter sp. TaxID=1962973 RepID=UPI0032653127